MDKYNTINDTLLKNPVDITRDVFWYNEPSILLRLNRLDEFFPSRDMTLEEQLNSFTRLSIYLSVVLYLYTFNVNYLYISIFTLVFTYLIYTNSNNREHRENYTNINNVVRPTRDNPYMNILPDDYLHNPNRESLSRLNNYKNSKLDSVVSEKSRYNLYRDSSDIYGRNTNQRQFYTTPITTIPNEQGKFANWLYKSPPTCKEGNGFQCVKNNYEHLRDSNIRNGIY
tara:strand:- start:478 stop:1158 length:681 start_codon:yes stop_codon:yes gene_type:complete